MEEFIKSLTPEEIQKLRNLAALYFVFYLGEETGENLNYKVALEVLSEIAKEKWEKEGKKVLKYGEAIPLKEIEKRNIPPEIVEKAIKERERRRERWMWNNVISNLPYRCPSNGFGGFLDFFPDFEERYFEEGYLISPFLEEFLEKCKKEYKVPSPQGGEITVIEDLKYISTDNPLSKDGFMFRKDDYYTLVKLIRNCRKNGYPVIRYNGRDYVPLNPWGFAEEIYDQIRKEGREELKRELKKRLESLEE